MPRAPADRWGRDASERKTNMEMTQGEINKLADKIDKVAALLYTAQQTAFRLAKEGNRSGVLQLRGAFSGTLEAAKRVDGFLTGLTMVV